MHVFRGLPAPARRAPCALTIGNFDGVHLGHRAMLARVVEAARARAIVPAVLTFEPHPLQVVAPERAPPRLTTLRDKLAALADSGIERVFVQRFDARFMALTPQQFIDHVLVERGAVRWLLVGDDFRFGARRAGGLPDLEAAAQAGRFELARMPTVDVAGERVSSSAVRAALDSGDLAHARRLLGRPLLISGRVRHGAKLGRTLGFPTLNLRLGDARPAAHGIFVVQVHALADRPLPAVASIGLRPTVTASGRWLLEVHVFDFDAQVYGRHVQVELLHKLRNEARYDSLAELQDAIARDAQQARAWFAQRAAATL